MDSFASEILSKLKCSRRKKLKKLARDSKYYFIIKFRDEGRKPFSVLNIYRLEKKYSQRCLCVFLEE